MSWISMQKTHISLREVHRWGIIESTTVEAITLPADIIIAAMLNRGEASKSFVPTRRGSCSTTSTYSKL